ncbi:LytR/AlgR family response regulator transcription factor [Thermophagus xiamenensis]|uniref:Two component transcriptional regulator, LytTR family n=1 Tax=Thermophagus xiamenensis TaxID=385682 RepID=A0A1I2DKH6_9BACT|nr:LytTR family DNA-binding domain-containing protein [Thermophagus xiamenensis]SFE80959.1 two component transcriptional regulator, LytTR family [Thermophagus xiamenensis]
MNYKILIVEDEPLLSASLRKKIETIKPELEIAGELRTVEDTVAWLKAHPEPAIIFMDIQLADGICFSIFEQVEVTNKGIVFTTAYDEYALEAFEVNSIAYLLKPIKTEALVRVFEKIETIVDVVKPFNRSPEIDYRELAMQVTQLQNKYRKRILVSRGDGFIQVPVEEIAYFSIEGKVTVATTFKQREHILDSTLSELEEELDPETFFRVNRQFILNVNAIHKVENYFGSRLVIKLLPNINASQKIVVSRNKAGEVKKWLDR